MNYEEKYKNALKWAQDCIKTGANGMLKEDLEYYFSELKESEDEMIRKNIKIALMSMEDNLSVFYSTHHTSQKELLAWLEKQGEHEKFRQKIQIGDQVTRNQDGELVNLSQLKRVAKSYEKQKPVDEAEPKFKVGDWIVTPDNETKQIEKVTFGNYWFTDKTLYNIIDTDNKGHLWTIQDAKDGDVLSFNDGHGNDSIELIKSITEKKIEFWFCLTNGNRYEVFDGIIPYTNLVSREDATPATKEQRDLLFQKMHEAGYEWDEVKKELKKIFQEYPLTPSECFKPIWSEEDEKWFREAISIITQYDVICRKEGDECYTANAVIDWLKSIKPQPKQKGTSKDEKDI